jgi:multiple sugar transport system ATP-binding protein
MTMGDRVAVLDAGYLQQIDTPQNLYDHPNNLFVATFIGSPQMNLVLGKIDLSGPSVDLGQHRLDLPAGVLESRPGLRKYDGTEVIVGIRPEDLEDVAVADAAEGARTLPVKILLREGLGSEVVVHAQLDARAPQVKTAQGDESGVLLEGTGVVMIARLDPRTKVAIDTEATFVVDVERLHWFDPGSGLAIYD